MGPNGTHQWIYNVQPKKRPEFGKGSPYNYKYSDEWTLAEWYVDFATQSYRLFINGSEIKGVAFSKGAGNFDKAEIPEVFESLSFGWNNYQNAGKGFVAWMDDIALSKERIGNLGLAAGKKVVNILLSPYRPAFTPATFPAKRRGKIRARGRRDTKTQRRNRIEFLLCVSESLCFFCQSLLLRLGPNIAAYRDARARRPCHFFSFTSRVRGKKGRYGGGMALSREPETVRAGGTVGAPADARMQAHCPAAIWYSGRALTEWTPAGRVPEISPDGEPACRWPALATGGRAARGCSVIVAPTPAGQESRRRRLIC